MDILLWLKQQFIDNGIGLYILCAAIGLYTNIYWHMKKEKRTKPNREDIFDLGGQFPLVLVLAIAFNTHPFVSLLVGIAPDRFLALAELIATSKLKATFKEIMNSAITILKDSKDEQAKKDDLAKEGKDEKIS